MVKWTDEAIKIAISRYLDRGPDETGWEGMRAALDAAVKAQGCILLDPTDEAYHTRSYEKGRADRTGAAEMPLMLCYAYVKFGDNDFTSFAVGNDGVKTITWRENNFLFVIYDDRALVLNLNQARYIEIKEPQK